MESHPSFPSFKKIEGLSGVQLIVYREKCDFFQTNIIAEQDGFFNFILLPVCRVRIGEGKAAHTYVENRTGFEIHGYRAISTKKSFVSPAFRKLGLTFHAILLPCYSTKPVLPVYPINIHKRLSLRNGVPAPWKINPDVSDWLFFCQEKQRDLDQAAEGGKRTVQVSQTR
jgi:hypothetical protein